MIMGDFFMILVDFLIIMDDNLVITDENFMITNVYFMIMKLLYFHGWQLNAHANHFFLQLTDFWRVNYLIF